MRCRKFMFLNVPLSIITTVREYMFYGYMSSTCSLSLVLQSENNIWLSTPPITPAPHTHTHTHTHTRTRARTHTHTHARTHTHTHTHTRTHARTHAHAHTHTHTHTHLSSAPVTRLYSCCALSGLFSSTRGHHAAEVRRFLRFSSRGFDPNM